MVLQVQVQKKVPQKKNWVCRCPRCSDVTEFGTYFSAMKCSHCHEGLILPETPAEGDMTNVKWWSWFFLQHWFKSLFELLNLLNYWIVSFRFFVALQVLFKSLWGQVHCKLGTRSFDVDQNLMKMSRFPNLRMSCTPWLKTATPRWKTSRIS